MLSLGYLAVSVAYLANASKFCKEQESKDRDFDCNNILVTKSTRTSESKFESDLKPYAIGAFGTVAAVVTLICQIGTLVLLILRLKFLNMKIPGMTDQFSILLLIVSCVADFATIVS